MGGRDRRHSKRRQAETSQAAAHGQADTFNCTAGACSGTLTFGPTLPGNLTGSYQLVSQGNPSSVLLSIPAKGIGTGPRIQFVPGQLSSIGSGLSFAQRVGVDSAGNVYIADSGNNRVVEVLANGGQQITIGSGFYSPTGIAVDSNHNVFVADTGHSRIVEISAVDGSQSVFASGFVNVAGIAVDSSGNLYAADSAARTVQRFPIGGGSPVALGTGWQAPFGIAVDSRGDVFVTDDGAVKVVEIPTGGGAQVTLPLVGLSATAGVAVDATLNVFVSDTGNNRILELPASGTGQFTLQSGLSYPGLITVGSNGMLYFNDENPGILAFNPYLAPALTFANTQVNTLAGGGPQTVTAFNAGNANLTLSAVNYPSNFPEVSGVGADCTSSTSLAPGATCTLSINFQPLPASSTGISTSLSQSVSLIDNNLNAAAAVQSITASGVSLQPELAVTDTAVGSFVLNGTGQWSFTVSNTTAEQRQSVN